nr:alanine racemase [uncultured Eisenbergiella sp.]
MKNYDRVWAAVDLDAVKYNMVHMKENIREETKIIAVVKTDGYGHGAVPIAHEIEDMPFLHGFAVATVEEALILRGSGIRKPVLVLGYTFPYCYEKMAREEIRPAVFREDMLEELGKAGTACGRPVKIHIKVDTGMSRIGIRPDESGLAFVRKCAETPGIEIEGLFTHFAKADEADKTSAKKQLETFLAFAGQIEERLGIRIPVRHCSNSAGIVELKEANLDVVRAGITLYGLWPSCEVKKDIVSLHPVLSLKSRIVYIKELEAGMAVSYGGTFVAKEPMQVATIPVGYGDGYPRSLSNKGHVLIHGKKAPILGRVCMDQFMVDVTGIPEAAQGDEVTLIGCDGEESITMEELGELSGRFNYELACCLNKRVPRIYRRDGKAVYSKDSFRDFR